MADDTALLIPIHIDALLVNNAVASGPFERWSNIWGNLFSYADPVPAPFSTNDPISNGVHLHWQLPSALTHGVAPSGSTTAAFPYLPNRWIVVRLAASMQGTAAQAMTAWIIESDFTDPELGTTPYMTADASGAPQATLLGRNVLVSQWQGEQSDGGLFLTATGIAQPSFLAYQPGLVDVYSFYDDTTGLADDTCLTYLVAGWYSNAASDPLVLEPAFDPQTNLFSDLDWLALGLSVDGTPPTRSVFHGLVNDLVWQAKTAPPRVDTDASAMQVALGNTSVDALSAILAQNGQSGALTLEQIEMMLAAFQYDSLALLDEPDAAVQLEQRIRRAWYGSTPGGTLWQIVPVSQGQIGTDPISGAVQAAPAPLTADQAGWLAGLNIRQRDFDIAQRDLKSQQWELFSLWWKLQYISEDVLYESGVDYTAMSEALYNQTNAGGGGNLFSTVAGGVGALARMAESLPDPTSPESVASFSPQIPGNSGTLALQPCAMPSFYQPADPVVLVAGITPPAAPVDGGQPLPCRLSTAATTGVDAEVGSAPIPITASAGGLGSIIRQPTDLPTSSSQPLSALLDPAVTAAVSALAVEAFFADPNNAASILSNGMSNTDPATIDALQMAMQQGSAQIATILDPLQADFAFALWQQAWTPLFLEWEVQFYPTVQTSFTGQQLPPQSLLATSFESVQDNLPMDLSDWSFDGSDNVSARGSEYFTWTGGDIWTANNWLVPQTFVGRSTLTANAETLFLARLENFIADQPVASATAILVGDGVSQTSLVSGGAGYNAAPAVTFEGGGGTGAAATAEIAGGAIVSITMTCSGSGYTTPPQVVIAPGDWQVIQVMVEAIGDTRFLSQTLSGFNDSFLMRQGVHTLSLDPGTAAVVGGEDRLIPNPEPGNVQILFGQGQPFFFPARGGYFQILALRIVDGFGQVLDLLRANGNEGGTAGTFQPILGPGLIPEGAIASQTYQVKQAPRLVQPSRLNLRWLDSSDDSEEVLLSPDSDANPVCGWLIPNQLDRSIAVYDVGGDALGELLVLTQTDGTKSVLWLTAPGSPAAVDDPADISNPHLQSALTAFTASDGGIPEDERVDAFLAWFNSIDETLWTVDPPGGRANGQLATLMGRPLALVRMGVGMELSGKPTYNQSWRDTFDLANLANLANSNSIEIGQQEAGFTSLPFPIQFGSVELLRDGVIGYFTGDTYTAFNAVHAAASPSSTYIQPVGGTKDPPRNNRFTAVLVAVVRLYSSNRHGDRKSVV